MNSGPSEIGKSRLLPFTSNISRWPWWAIVAALLGVLFAWIMATDKDYEIVFRAIVDGLRITIFVTIVAYAIALLLGLIIALGRVSPNVIIQQVSTFYVEIIRGIPTLVVLIYVAYVFVPAIVEAAASLGKNMVATNTLPSLGNNLAGLTIRNVDEVSRVIIALALSYSAFLAEIYRAGIESIERGQMEAARALGMTYWQAMRFVILRQAIRQVLPPLGNDFIAMLKDSSLVSVIGVHDITLLGKLYDASTFRTAQIYNVVAYLYLVMTLLLSLGVKWIERAMARERRRA